MTDTQTDKAMGRCDFKQYEHCGPHERIPEVGQRFPPFGCKNWRPDESEQIADKAIPRAPDRIYVTEKAALGRSSGSRLFASQKRKIQFTKTCADRVAVLPMSRRELK